MPPEGVSDARERPCEHGSGAAACLVRLASVQQFEQRQVQHGLPGRAAFGRRDAGRDSTRLPFGAQVGQELGQQGVVIADLPRDLVSEPARQQGTRPAGGDADLHAAAADDCRNGERAGVRVVHDIHEDASTPRLARESGVRVGVVGGADGKHGVVQVVQTYLTPLELRSRRHVNDLGRYDQYVSTGDQQSLDLAPRHGSSTRDHAAPTANVERREVGRSVRPVSHLVVHRAEG